MYVSARNVRTYVRTYVVVRTTRWVRRSGYRFSVLWQALQGVLSIFGLSTVVYALALEAFCLRFNSFCWLPPLLCVALLGPTNIKMHSQYREIHVTEPPYVD